MSSNIKAPPTISAVKRYPRRKKRGGENVLWKRMTSAFDSEVKQFANEAAIRAPLTRLVFFNHLTPMQGFAGRRYATIMREFDRYHVPPGQRRTAKSQSFEPQRPGSDDELGRRFNNGTMGDYEKDARYARKQYDKLQKVMDGFKDPITGRNFAKDIVESLVLDEREPEASHRADIGRVLTAIALAFGLGENARRR